MPKVDMKEVDALMKFDKKVKLLPKPCTKGEKGCPDTAGNDVKAPEGADDKKDDAAPADDAKKAE